MVIKLIKKKVCGDGVTNVRQIYRWSITNADARSVVVAILLVLSVMDFWHHAELLGLCCRFLSDSLLFYYFSFSSEITLIY